MSVSKLLTKLGIALVLMVAFGACGNGKQVSSVEDLQGEWTVVEVKGQAIASDSEAFLGFNVADKQVYGNCGCNSLTGIFIVDEPQPGSLSLDQVGVTRRMCPDMTTEDAILSALAEVKGFGIENDILKLADAEGNELMELKKK